MDTSFTEEQLKVLKEDFGLEPKDLKSYTLEQWRDIREKCVDIILEEVGNEDEDDNPSERFLTAESITDITYKMLQELLENA